MATSADTDVLWRAGRLKFLLHADQKLVYADVHAWRRRCEESRAKGERLVGKYPRLFCLDMSRRYGKDYLSWVLALEVALSQKNANIIYSTAAAKDIAEIVLPLHNKLMETCPPALRGEYKNSYRGFSQGVFFPNGSVIKLVGLDLHPDHLRGRAADACFVSEGAFVNDLERTIETVIMPQFLGRNHAFLVVNSTPPDALHDWDEFLVPDAITRNAYAKRTIFDCPLYSPAEKEEFLKRDPETGEVPPRQRREYLCERVRDETKTVVPEFLVEKHVKEFELPKFAHAYVSIDPAIKDILAVLYMVWDFERHKLLVVDEFAERNCNTDRLVEDIRAKEALHFSKLHYWDGKKLAQNPFLRVSDVDQRLITDLNQLHGIEIGAAQKDDKEAALHGLRSAIQAGHVVIHPRCKETQRHLLGAQWNKARSDYLRSEQLGHCDLLDALVYGWRHVARSSNPFPPSAWLALQKASSPDVLFYTKEMLKTPNSLVGKLSNLFPKKVNFR